MVSKSILNSNYMYQIMEKEAVSCEGVDTFFCKMLVVPCCFGVCHIIILVRRTLNLT